MADTMTRVQAICACRNISILCDVLDRAPEDFRAGISDRAESMEKSITANTRYPRITKNMDTALRNMWGGLKRWDRDDEYLDDIFDDLEAVEEEMADFDASQGEEKKPPKGRETDDTAAQARSQRFQSKVPNPPGNGPRAQGETRAAPATTTPAETTPSTPAAPSIALTEVLRRKEAAVGAVLEMVHEAPITLVDKTLLRSLAVADVLNMTKSDRNQQLIRAAYYVGVLRGIKLLHGKLQNDDD